MNGKFRRICLFYNFKRLLNCRMGKAGPSKDVLLEAASRIYALTLVVIYLANHLVNERLRVQILLVGVEILCVLLISK